MNLVKARAYTHTFKALSHFTFILDNVIINSLLIQMILTLPKFEEFFGSHHVYV